MTIDRLFKESSLYNQRIFLNLGEVYSILMNRILITSSLVLITVVYVSGQSKLVSVSKSQLTGIELPAGAKQDNRILSTAGAKTLLQMTAEENAATLGEQVEVFSMPLETGSQLVEQIKAAARKAGWEIRPFSKEATYSLLVNKQRTILMYLESLKKETALYLSPVTHVKTETPAEVIKVDAPVKVVEQVKTVEPVKTEVQQPVQVIPPVEATKAQQSTTTSTDGFTFNTINFDDGWISTIAADYVKVVKGNMEVLLYYSFEINDQVRATNLEMRDYFWNLLVVPNYTVKSAFPLNESLTYFKIHFTEGDAVDKTGKPVYLAMTVLVNSGIATPVLAIASDKNSYYQQFPEPKNLGNMTGYNRFAVGAKDVVGSWSASSGASVNLYNTYTGNYAGMNYAQSSDSFQFNGDGTYSSKHSGASGVYGTTTVYTQEYKGKLSVTNWDMSMTNRWKDASETFNAWFEVVRGGRIFHLRNKTASGIMYHLVKVK